MQTIKAKDSLKTKDYLKIRDKKASAKLNRSLEQNSEHKFGYGGSLKSNKLTEIHDGNNYFCCSSSSGSSTVSKR